MLRILRANDVRAAVDMPAAIAVMHTAFAQLASGMAEVPERVAVSVPDQDATALVMPAYLRTGRELGVKVVGVFPGNVARGLPTVPATVLLLDAATGLPLALMDGTYLTALRTGAASGLATDLLARPEARVVALFGAGGQAPYQLEAVCRVRHVERVWLVNRTRAHAELLAEQIAGWGEWQPSEIRVAAPAAIQAAVTDADVILTATSSPEPLFAGEWVRPGTHVNAIGAFTPAMCELDAALLRRALVVVDQRAAALAEAGDILRAMREGALGADAIHAELGELALGTRPSRTDPEQITVFKSVGLAVQDVAVASYAYREAIRLGLGTEIAI
jgi:ornithine cyclodeaminase